MRHGLPNQACYDEVQIEKDNFHDYDYITRKFKLVTKRPKEPAAKNLGLRYQCTAIIGTEENPERCRWSFTKKAHLDRHSLTHTPIGCLVCQLCNIASKYSYNMYDHWKKRCKALCEDSQRAAIIPENIPSSQLKIMVHRRMIELGRGGEFHPHGGSIFVLNPRFMLDCVDQIKELSDASCLCCNLTMLIVYQRFHEEVHLMKKRIDCSVNNVWFCNLCSSNFLSQSELYKHWRSSCRQMIAFGSSAGLTNMELASLAFNILQQSIPLEYYYTSAKLKRDREKMVSVLRSQPCGQNTPDGNIYVYTGKLHPTGTQNPTNDDIFNECVNIDSFRYMGGYNQEQENMNLSKNRENALAKWSPFSFTEFGEWVDAQGPDGQQKRVYVFQADNTVLNSYGFNDRTLPRLNNSLSETWNVQKKGEKCIKCEQMFSSKGRLNEHKCVYDEKNFCVLCQTAFTNSHLLCAHFKKSCGFANNVFASNIRDHLDRDRMHLLIMAINKTTQMYFSNPQAVRYIIDKLADAVIKETCTTDTQVDQVIEDGKNEFLRQGNCTEMLINIAIASEVIYPPIVQNYLLQKQILQNDRPLQPTTMRKSAVIQTNPIYRNTVPNSFYKQPRAEEAKLYNSFEQNQKQQQQRQQHQLRLPQQPRQQQQQRLPQQPRQQQQQRLPQQPRQQQQQRLPQQQKQQQQQNRGIHQPNVVHRENYPYSTGISTQSRQSFNSTKPNEMSIKNYLELQMRSGVVQPFIPNSLVNTASQATTKRAVKSSFAESNEVVSNQDTIFRDKTDPKPSTSQNNDAINSMGNNSHQFKDIQKPLTSTNQNHQQQSEEEELQELFENFKKVNTDYHSNWDFLKNYDLFFELKPLEVQLDLKNNKSKSCTDYNQDSELNPSQISVIKNTRDVGSDRYYPEAQSGIETVENEDPRLNVFLLAPCAYNGRKPEDEELNTCENFTKIGEESEKYSAICNSNLGLTENLMYIYTKTMSKEIARGPLSSNSITFNADGEKWEGGYLCMNINDYYKWTLENVVEWPKAGGRVEVSDNSAVITCIIIDVFSNLRPTARAILLYPDTDYLSLYGDSKCMPLLYMDPPNREQFYQT